MQAPHEHFRAAVRKKLIFSRPPPFRRLRCDLKFFDNVLY